MTKKEGSVGKLASPLFMKTMYLHNQTINRLAGRLGMSSRIVKYHSQRMPNLPEEELIILLYTYKILRLEKIGTATIRDFLNKLGSLLALIPYDALSRQTIVITRPRNGKPITTYAIGDLQCTSQTSGLILVKLSEVVRNTNCIRLHVLK